MATSIDERLVGEVAGALRGPRGLPFSDRQLWYAVCARLEAPQLTEATAQLAVGIGLIAVGVLLGSLVSVIVALLVPIGMVIAGLGIQRRRVERNRPTTRPLAVSYDRFVRDAVAPRGGRIAGLIVDPQEQPAPGVAPDAGVEIVLVCDRGETASLVEALCRSAGLGVVVTDESAAAMLTASSRLFALHDADPRGCALPLRLAAAGAAAVVDIGLRPAQLFAHHAQVIEGAPALVPAELSGLLTPDEVVWLAEGRRIELATLTPAELVAGLGAALAAHELAAPGHVPTSVRLSASSLVPPPPAVDA